jgi:hypothetical protein
MITWRPRFTMSRQRFRTRRSKDPGQRPRLARRPLFGQLAASPTSSPVEGPPTSLRLAWEVSALHEKSPPRMTRSAPTSSWAQTCSESPRREHPTDACGGTILHAIQVQQLAAMQAAHPDRSLNAGLTGCVAITSPSSPTLLHASSTQGTQAPSTMRTLSVF